MTLHKIKLLTDKANGTDYGSSAMFSKRHPGFLAPEIRPNLKAKYISLCQRYLRVDNFLVANGILGTGGHCHVPPGQFCGASVMRVYLIYRSSWVGHLFKRNPHKCRGPRSPPWVLHCSVFSTCLGFYNGSGWDVFKGTPCSFSTLRL